MLVNHQGLRRRQATNLTEFAMVVSIFVLAVFVLSFYCVGVFRFQQLATLARYGARWAAVHGRQYQQDYSRPPGDVKAFIRAQAAGINPSDLTINVMFADPGSGIPPQNLPDTWAGSTQAPFTNVAGTDVHNRVAVEIVYTWAPQTEDGSVLPGFSLIPSATMRTRSVVQVDY
jgi:hypothetical protein